VVDTYIQTNRQKRTRRKEKTKNKKHTERDEDESYKRRWGWCVGGEERQKQEILDKQEKHRKPQKELYIKKEKMRRNIRYNNLYRSNRATSTFFNVVVVVVVRLIGDFDW